MRTPEQLSREELVAVVRRFQQAFYRADDGNGHVWNPDKEHDSGTLADAANILSEFGLAPTEEMPFAEPFPVLPTSWGVANPTG